MSQTYANSGTIEDSWDAIRAELRNRWPMLTAKDLQLIDGDSRKLIALVHQRTGDNLTQIEAAMDEIAAGSGGLLSRVSCQAREAVATGANAAGELASSVAVSVGTRVRQRPVRAVAWAAGLGVVLGVTLVCLTSREA